jgi:hypothetical protein
MTGAMAEPEKSDKASAFKSNPLPIAAPARRTDEPARKGVPDLRIEEIEERHIPKDRNIFDK